MQPDQFKNNLIKTRDMGLWIEFINYDNFKCVSCG